MTEKQLSKILEAGRISAIKRGWSEDRVYKIKELRRQGYSFDKIALILGCSKNCAYQNSKRIKKGNLHDQR